MSSMTTDVPNIVRRLADRLVATSHGDIVTWEQLSVAIGQDAKLIRSRLYQALKVAENESGAKFATQYRKGYRRLHSNELVKIGQSARKHVRTTVRAANRGMTAGMRVANDLSRDETHALLREQSAMGLLEEAAKEKHLPKPDPDEVRPLAPGQAARQLLSSLGVNFKEQD